jgi:predicted amidohydrolase
VADPERESTVTIATASMHVVHDKNKNLEKYDDFIARAAAAGARLLVLPEQSLQGYMWGVSHSIEPAEYRFHHAHAETIPGESTKRLALLAKRHKMYILFGMTETANYDVLYNSAVLVGPDGTLGVFRKVHGPGDELHIYKQGDEWPVFETAIGRIGALICYDAIFPESARELALGGAEIICMPTAVPRLTNYPDRYRSIDDIGQDLLRERYFAMTILRAVENQRWFVSSNQTGSDDMSDLQYCGHSRIVAPTGEVLADTGDAEGLACASIAVQQGILDAKIEFFDVLKDRAPKTYRLISDDSVYRPPTRINLTTKP